jgi:uncharacterized protein (DUF433 family)
MNEAYVEERDGGYWVRGTRISLESVVSRFLEGLSPETIQSECFPTLSRAQVEGAISFYLDNRQAVDCYLRQTERDFAAVRQRLAADYPDAKRKFDAVLQDALAPQ